MKKLITIITTIAIAIFGFSLVPVSTTYAVTDICSSDAKDEVKKANGCPGYGEPTTVKEVIVGILNGVISILSLVTVIFVIVGGVHYMTSAGDAGKIEKAKKTILYAIIGLIICVLAFAIVNFVVNNILQ